MARVKEVVVVEAGQVLLFYLIHLPPPEHGEQDVGHHRSQLLLHVYAPYCLPPVPGHVLFTCHNRDPDQSEESIYRTDQSEAILTCPRRSPLPARS